MRAGWSEMGWEVTSTLVTTLWSSHDTHTMAHSTLVGHTAHGASFYPLLVSFCLKIVYRKVKNLQIGVNKL